MTKAKTVTLTKREAKAVVAGLLWCSSCFKLGISQVKVLRKIFTVWPDLYEPEFWPELEKEA